MVNTRLTSISSIERDLFFFLKTLGQLHVIWNNAAFNQLRGIQPELINHIQMLELIARSMENTCQAQQNVWTRVERKRKSNTNSNDFGEKCRKI